MEYIKKNKLNKIVRFIATGFYIGEKFPAPGTAASIFAAAVYFLIIPAGGTFYWKLLTILIIVGVITAGMAEDMFGEIDPPQIVIDEIAGFFVAMAFLPKEPGLIIIGLIIFRIIDITKIYPMNKLESISGGLGIMIDDLYAGLVTNVILQIINRV